MAEMAAHGVVGFYSYFIPLVYVIVRAGKSIRRIRSKRDRILLSALALNCAVAIFDLKTLTEHLRLSTFPLRVGADGVGTFGLLALILATIGIYGGVAYAAKRFTTTPSPFPPAWRSISSRGFVAARA